MASPLTPNLQRRKVPLVGLMLVLVAVLLACSPPSEPAPDGPDDRPDVVLVVIDTLRPDHLPFYGYDGRDTAPFLGELAQRSTVFRRAFSTSSWTAPSTASLFTSLYPTQHGVTEGFFHHARRLDGEGRVTEDSITLNRLPADVATLPELFREAGYTTFGIGANVNIGPAIGFDRGFDHFHKIEREVIGDTLTSPLAFQQLEAWEPELEEGKPNFVYLHFNDIHGPHAAVAPWFEYQENPTERLRQAYISELSFLDKAMGLTFKRFGWDDAIVMVVSDHGQEFKEHGSIGHGPTLYRELVQILMMVSDPRADSVGREVTDVNVSLVDVVPTLAELAGLQPDAHWEGTSLAPFLGTGGRSEALTDQLDERVLFTHRVDLLHASRAALYGAIQGDWKLIRTTGGELELYNFIADPDEQRNAREDEPDITRRLQLPLRRFQAFEQFGTRDSVQVEVDEAFHEELRALGYVGY